MHTFANIAAVVFDMDGTLVDSEILTEPTIRLFCRRMNIPAPAFDFREFYGVSWGDVTARLVDAYPQLADTPDVPMRLHRIFHDMANNDPPVPIRGAREAVLAAHGQMPTAIVSSSYRESIEETIRRLGIEEHVTWYAGAEDYGKPKPAADGFLKAAEVLDIEPRECLVFEDSAVGLRAARNAGMHVVAITHRSNDAKLAETAADLAIEDFSELDEHFFATIRRS